MQASALLAAIGIVLRLLAPYVAVRLAGLLLVLIGWTALLVSIAPEPLQDRAVLVSAAMVGAFVVAAVLAWYMRFRVALLAGLVGLCLPLRIPFEVDGDDVSLLLPLYAVIGIALLWQIGNALRVSRGIPPAVSQIARRPMAPHDIVPMIDIAVAMLTIWSCSSLSWAVDLDQGATEAALFVIPFATLYCFARTASAMVAARSAGFAAGGAFVAVMLVAAAVGVVQRLTHTVWLNPKIEVSNVYNAYFRTNSFFFDPNIYGRYLVVALVAVLSLVVFARLRRGMSAAALAAIALLLTGLWFSYSGSSFIALATACVVLVAFLLSRRVLLAGTALVLVAAAIAIPTLQPHKALDDGGRLDVARGAIDVISIQPVIGVGLASSETAYVTLERLRGSERPKLRASHTTPLTVAAELGIVGLVGYITLLIGVGLVATGRRRGTSTIAQRFAVASFFALVTHSLVYAGFFEDPLSWLLAAIATCAWPAAEAISGPAGVREPRTPVAPREDDHEQVELPA